MRPCELVASRSRGLRPVVAVVLALGALIAVTPGHALLWPSEARRVEVDLGSPDVAVRRRAARRLTELAGAPAARATQQALSDADQEVRLIAVEAAKALRLPALGDRVQSWLTESDPKLRLAAAEVLAAEPSPRSVGALARALSDVEPSVRAAAAAALGATGAAEAVIGLLGRLDDPALEVKESVVRALARLGDARAVVPLISKIEDPRPGVRRAVARALGELGDRRAVSALVLVLRDPDPAVRAAALAALSDLGDPSAAPSVAALLAAEGTSAVRAAAVEALGRLATPESVARLIEALGALPDERDAIQRALGSLGATAVPALLRCVATAEPGSANGCATALAATRAPEAGAALRDGLRRARLNPETALYALGELRDVEAMPLALEHLAHVDPAVRRAALSAAGALIDPRSADGRAVEPLELAFQRARGRRAERLSIVHLLGRTGSARAARLLVPIAREADDLSFRLAAIESLASIPDPRVAGVLLDALADEEPSVRREAALSLRRSRLRGLAGKLVERLEQASPADRSTISLALSGVMHDADEASLRRIERALTNAAEGERDGLIEALARAHGATALRALTALARSRAAADRAKVAEGLAFRSDAQALVAKLLADTEPRVRANAVWTLGGAGSARDAELALRSVGDQDVQVAANAVSAFARLGARHGFSRERELCALAADRRGAVRAAAFSGLRLQRRRCDGRERRAVASDPVASARRAAAELIRDVARAPDDERTLRRCQQQETSGSVAAACVGPPVALSAGPGAEILAFVVPAGESAPIGSVPFALRRADSLIRHGVADRRGAVAEPGVPNGEVELAVPAALEE